MGVRKRVPGQGGATRARDGRGLVVALEICGVAKTMLPFNDAVRSGIPGLLMGHEAVPALDPGGENRSAALSPNLVGHVLREQWGYEGVLIADDVAHAPLTKSLPEERAIVQALAAGCDAVIFLDPNPERIMAAVRAIETAVENGELSWEQLDASKRRLDAWRRWLERRDTSLLREARERIDVVQRAARQRLAEAAAQRKAETERLAKLEAERKAKEDAQRKAEADARAKAKEDARLKVEADRLAKLETARKAEAQHLAKLEADRKAKEAARLKAEAEAQAKAEAEAEAQRKAEDARLATNEAERQTKEAARRKA